MLEASKEVVEELVPELGLVQVGGVPGPWQHLGLGGARDEGEVLS